MPETSGLVFRVAIGSSSLRPQLFGCRLDRVDDVHVPGAAAQVAADGLTDLHLARAAVPGEQRAAGDHHPGGAVPALQAVLLPEALLDGVELAILLQAF